jgi:hypothetical protein
MKLTKHTLFCVSMFIAFGVFAQLQQYQMNNLNSFNEGNPDTYSATRSTIYSVNEATGIPSISVPFFTITQNGYSLPISISYSASGIRVDESASRIGLGWTLNAGGIVSRTTKGIPDYSTGADGTGYKSYVSSNPLPLANQSLTGTGIQSVLGKIFTGQTDGEPDLTMYSFGSRGGKFFVNPENNIAYPIPYQNILIESGAFAPYPEGYKITDEDGNQFIFADIERVTIRDSYGTVLSPSKNTGYYLTKIILTDKSSIAFIYNTISYSTFTGNRDTKIDRIMGPESSGLPCDAQATAGSGATQMERTSIYLHTITPRLQTIVYDQGRIEFTYSTSARSDIAGDFRLMQITQYDMDNEVKKYVLDHDYTPTYDAANPTNGRLRLKKVTERDKNGNDLLPVTFSYDNTAFPTVGTPKQDLWGYYNNEVNETVYSVNGVNVKSLLPRTENGQYTFVTQGALRTISPTYTQAAVLNGIAYPDGATVTFTFENNVYRDVVSSSDKTGPGLRIKMITANDGLGNIKYTSYKYLTEGSSPYSSGRLNDLKFSSNIYFSKTLSFATCTCQVRTADPLNKTPFLSGIPIYYTRVEVTEHSDPINITGSKIGSTVSLFDFHNDYNSQVGLFLIKDHLNALLKKETIYNKAGNIVASTDYTYAGPVDSSWLIGTMPFIQTLKTDGSVEVYGYNTYKIFSSWMPVSSIVKRIYSVDLTSFQDQTTTFTYNPISLLPATKTVTTGGTTYKIIYKRPHDYNITIVTDEQSLAIKEFKAKHIYTPVIESVSLKNGLVMEAEMSHYKILSMGVFPKRSYTLKNMAPYAEASHTFAAINTSGNFTYSANYKKQSEVGVYDDSGIPIEINTRNSVSAMIFNPRVERTIAICDKAGQNDIAYCSFEDYELTNILTPALHTSSNWTLLANCSTNVKGTEAFAGTGSIQLGGSCNIGIVSGKPLTTTTTYRLTFWAKNGNPNVSSTGGSVPPYIILQTTNGWNLYQYLITGATAITIGMDGSCMIDELKLSPADASLSNTVFKPLVGALSESDDNNNYTHYVYDNFGRVVKVLDHSLNIVKTIEYIQQEQQ